MPFEVALATFVALVGIGLGAFFSSARPYNIIAESWKQTLATVRCRPRLFAYAWGVFAIREAALFALSSTQWPSVWLFIAARAALQAFVIYVLAHIALRLHRGLILGEWAPGVTVGRRERRMALYVVLCWLIVGALTYPPIPPPPLLSAMAFKSVGLVFSCLAFLAKAALALTGPAASLDDPKPLTRSVRSFAREPVAILLIIVALEFMVDTSGEAIGLFLRAYLDSPTIRLILEPFVLALMAFVLLFSEFALVIALTRIWEDHFEPETRAAAHNFNWT